MVSTDTSPFMSPVCKMEGPFEREFALYNGVSNRSRGWKTKKSDKTAGMNSLRSNSVMRWDGASMSCNAWDNLKRDPELWCRDGNCYIHLYGQGQSRRGPAFKVPFSGLLEEHCLPLIDRFMTRNMTRPAEYFLNGNGDAARRSRIELFIPAPSRSTKQQAYQYRLATRNFIAYVFRRSMVGENLGDALITLMHSMHEFRSENTDSVQDLMDYLDEEGYLNFRNHPIHALAALHLAETFQLKDLYIDAIAHCCGMGDQIFNVPEYQLVSPTTRKLIRRARVGMNLRLGQNATLLTNFLRNELMEAHLGLYAGAQAHLERFRILLHNFYTTKFGSYPPPTIDSRTNIFKVDVYRMMRNDFEALYQYLVDESFNTLHSNPFLAEGGICTWQSIVSFDMRQEFKTLFHPFPLLPKVSQEGGSKKHRWLGQRIKLVSRQRENTHAALLKATNQRPDLLANGLVQAYRQFEESLVYLPKKLDKLESLGPMDGRKIRWILIYAIYQTLRQATETPPEVRDVVGTPYHLCISTTDLPPWDEALPIYSLVRKQTDHVVRRASSPETDWSSQRRTATHQRSFEIKPDIDYLAIAHRESVSIGGRDGTKQLRKSASWKGSLTKSISQTLTVRRPSAKLTKPQPDRAGQPPGKMQYREIVVQGYGNGTRGIEATLANAPPPPSAVQHVPIAEEDPASTSPSRHSSSSYLRNSEDASVVRTSADTSVCESPCTYLDDDNSVYAYTPTDGDDGDHQRDEVLPRQAGGLTTTACMGMGVGVPPKESTMDVSCGLIRWRSRSIDRDVRRVSSVVENIEMPTPQPPTAWDQVKARMEVKASSWFVGGVMPEWEQYNDLGGLTELRPNASGTTPQRPK
ncbi:hypothetical protein GGR53DRAFT_150902 [Hypoxylon sp. FL1150]|nr:hypothetical protein GGR53DRAFT_150902 [Hypoxylon sp. FL1150]